MCSICTTTYWGGALVDSASLVGPMVGPNDGRIQQYINNNNKEPLAEHNSTGVLAVLYGLVK